MLHQLLACGWLCHTGPLQQASLTGLISFPLPLCLPLPLRPTLTLESLESLLYACSYNFVSTAISQSGERSKEAMTGQVTTPGAFP